MNFWRSTKKVVNSFSKPSLISTPTWKGKWFDPDKRAHLAERLRRALRRRHAARLGERSLTSDEQRSLETSDDLRPALYRHLLLCELDEGDLRAPDSETAPTILQEAVRRAEKNFHNVYKPGSRCDVNNSGDAGNSAINTILYLLRNFCYIYAWFRPRAVI